jgi:hypothetical protein
LWKGRPAPVKRDRSPLLKALRGRSFIHELV